VRDLRIGFRRRGGIDTENTVPELTVTADGWHWHSAGADVDTSPDMLLARPEVSMAEAKRQVVELFLSATAPATDLRDVTA
jgi:hypothetical protein